MLPWRRGWLLLLLWQTTTTRLRGSCLLLLWLRLRGLHELSGSVGVVRYSFDGRRCDRPCPSRRSGGRRRRPLRRRDARVLLR